MSGKELYRRFVKLCERWPRDESKLGRDYAEIFRSQIAQRFPHGELGKVVDPHSTEAYISSLERLANNAYFNEDPLKKSSSTGNLDPEQCRKAVSNEVMAALNEEEEGTLVARLRQSLKMKYAIEPNDEGKDPIKISSGKETIGTIPGKQINHSSDKEK